MGKRKLEDAINGDAPAAVELTEKKSKKEKKDKKERKEKKAVEVEAVVTTNGDGAEPVVVELVEEVEKEEKKDKKDKKDKKEKTEKKAKVQENGVPVVAGDVVMEDASVEVGEKKQSKEERKAAKKEAKRLAKLATGLESVSVPTTNGATTNGASNTISTNGKDTATLTPVSVDDAVLTKYMTDNAITIFDALSPDTTLPTLSPILSFDQLPKADPKHLTPFKDYKAPTPIQSVSWPYLLAKRDLIGVAETGSGKTMAFAYPAIRYLLSLPPRSKKDRSDAKVVVVSPTRELAMQIFEQMEKLAIAAGLKDSIVCVYGGVPKDPQRASLAKATIIVATPGRLVDFIQEGAADLSSAGYVVLDEADRMLDKGFEDAIREILSGTPATPNRQTLMFTATWPQSVRQLASTFMTKPVRIGINTPADGDLRANIRISQTVHVLADPRSKEQRLLQILQSQQRASADGKNDRILVFALYKKEATRIEGFLRSKGIRVGGIHGDLNQQARTAALAEFKAGRTPVLVATDVAARGLDIPNVKLVVNVTFPLTVEDYVHRIGRTGRAGENGIAITLFTEHDKAHSGSLINVLKAAGQPVPDELLKFGTTVKKKEHSAYGAFYKDTEGVKAATKITFED